MKKTVLAVLVVLAASWPFLALFGPVGIIFNATSRAMAEGDISPAFIKLVEVYNMLCEKQIEPNRVKVLWGATGKTLDNVEDAIWTFDEFFEEMNEEEDVQRGYCWNTRQTLNCRRNLLTTPKEIAEIIDQGRILYAHFDKDKFNAKNLKKWGFGKVAKAKNKRIDCAVVITDRKGDKIIARTPKGEKEIEFYELAKLCDYIIVFNSPTWQKRRQSAAQ